VSAPYLSSVVTGEPAATPTVSLPRVVGSPVRAWRAYGSRCRWRVARTLPTPAARPLACRPPPPSPSPSPSPVALPVSPGVAGFAAVGTGIGQEVQGFLGVGEDPDGACSADVEGVGVAECAEGGGDCGDGVVEREGVGGVGDDGHGGGGGGVAVV